MSKLTNEERNQQIQDLMVSVRRNTQGSRCIEVFEILLNEIEDKEVVNAVMVDTHRFAGEFLRLGRDVDNMKNVDFISKILTHEFIQPARFFYNSRKYAKLYLAMSDILAEKYGYIVDGIDKKVVLPNANSLGDIFHKNTFTANETVAVAKYFGDLSNLTADEVREKYELARKVVLIYNYEPAVVKAFIQTKRRQFNLDKNSKKYE